MQQLHDLIAASEGPLTARIIHYAKELGYTPFTSTLEQAWRASIHGLSAPILEALAEGRSLSAVRAEADYARDPIAFYGIEAARRHRTRGITLGLFLGLMKSYRRAYLDLADTLDVSAERREHHRMVIGNFFDRMEVGFCDEWAGRPADEQFEDLARQNRLITNEKNKYLTIFESLNDPAILIGTNGGIENMNFAASSLFLSTDAPGAGYYGGRHLPIVEVIGFDPAEAGDAAQEREIETAVGRRWFDVRTQRMLDVSEKYLGTVVILVDITEHRRAKDEAQRADRAKSGFLATMSHEIRTPIHGILGLAELLAERPLAAQEKGWVEAIARSGEILSSVVADILDYSKIEAGVLDVEEVEFPVGGVVEDVFGLMQPIARRKPDLALVLETPRLPTIVGDPGKLRQILLNLVGNAIKFTDHGTVWLAVQEIVEPGPTWMLRFVVADTGIGIAADRLEKIFEPFTQSDGSVARRYGGTGLGLAICRSLVHRIGGEIGVSSRPGDGSRFWFTIPFEPVVGHSPLPAGGAEEETQPLGPLDVLVVEDNEVNAMVASGLLERAGHRATVAPTGGAAIERILAHDHDLVLMDLRLPDIDGIETTRRIRALADRHKAAVPIVALSAQVVKTDIDACLEAGMNDFLGKPFHLERLEATLRRVIGASAAPSSPSPAPAPAADDTVEIDRRVLDGHVAALGRETTDRIVATFVAVGGDLSTRLDRLDHGDDRALAEIAHRLKSSALHVGLGRLSERAAEIEQRLRAGAGVAPGSAAALAAECRSSIAALERSWTGAVRPQPAKT